MQTLRLHSIFKTLSYCVEKGDSVTQPRFCGKVLLVALAYCAIATVSYGQVSPTPQPAPASADKAKAVPVSMTECEGVNNCATWTFLGTQGNGQWPSGEIANLSVERYDDNSVVIRRADSTGSSAGLTAVYNGTRKGTRVGGEFTSSWPGHWDSKSGNWYAMVEKEPQSPPTVMHFCDVNCTTLQWDKGRYVTINRNGFESADFSDIWTVESFTRESVILHRTATGNFAFSVVYKGQISQDGNTLINAANPFASLSGQPAQIRLAWGTALNTVPGGNAERDRGQPQPRVIVPIIAPAVCIPWFLGWICD